MKHFFITFSFLLILVSCSKKPVITPSREDILRNGKWKISAGKVYGRLPSGKDTILDYLSFLIPECYKDNYIIFDSLYKGALYNGANRCDPSEGDMVPFQWRLTNNNNNIDIYNGYNNIYGYTDTLQPVRFDTLAYSPLVLDTVLGVSDTDLGYTRSVIVLDSIWDVKLTPSPLPGFNIYDAQITDFSQSSFTLHFSYITKYIDSTNHHATFPRMLPDTLRYIVTFTNF